MKNKYLFIGVSIALIFSASLTFAQAPDLGVTANFVLFSTNGSVSNTGITHLTGNVGTNSGSSTGFGNVDGQMHDNDMVTAAANADLLVAYNDLNDAIPTFFLGPVLGDGVTLVPGVYSVASAASLNLELILDGEGDPDAVFIFQIAGAFSTNANAKVKLINGAKACNVFWKVEGLVDMAAGTTMRGTVVANNAAILMNTGDTLEGRLLAIADAITVDGIFGYTPIGCGSPTLTGPAAPDLLSTVCYGILSGDGPVSNAGISYVTGDVGTNVGLTTGFDPLAIAGILHPIPDVSTSAAAADLLTVYDYLNLLSYDIELLYPPQFGNNLVLTPHTYVMNGAVTFTDTLYLNAQGNADAVFIIQVNGAFSTSTYSNVVLMNGTKPENVFWKIEGAVEINDFSIFKGTIVCNNGAIDLKTGVTLEGRSMTTNGAIGCSAIASSLTRGCLTLYPPQIVSQPIANTVCEGYDGSFTVVAIGSELTYQWRKGATELVNGGAISGANAATLHINNVIFSDFATDYNVVVSRSGGPSVTSVDAELIRCFGSGIEVLADATTDPIVTLYPNPFTTHVAVYVNAGVPNEQLTITVYSMLGEAILTAQIMNQLTLLDVTNLPSGMYTYSIASDKNILQTGKIIAQK